MGENVKSFKKENDRLREQIKSLSKNFENLKDKMAAEVNKSASTTTCEPPNEQDVQFLSDGYDELVKSSNRRHHDL